MSNIEADLKELRRLIKINGEKLDDWNKELSKDNSKGIYNNLRGNVKGKA